MFIYQKKQEYTNVSFHKECPKSISLVTWIALTRTVTGQRRRKERLYIIHIILYRYIYILHQADTQPVSNLRRPGHSMHRSVVCDSEESKEQQGGEVFKFFSGLLDRVPRAYLPWNSYFSRQVLTNRLTPLPGLGTLWLASNGDWNPIFQKTILNFPTHD